MCVDRWIRPTRWVMLVGWMVLGCSKNMDATVSAARSHVERLAQVVAQDVQEVRAGLPQGAPYVRPLFESQTPAGDDLKAAREALDRARNKVQDLRVAKSTFFAVADADGRVLRTDQELDRMAGKDLFASFPELKKALSGGYLESRGSMAEASGVQGKEDGQWVAAFPVMVGDKARGLYVTGWSWAGYAYRLETSVRDSEQSRLMERGGRKMPLLYVYVVVGDKAYGAPVSPQVNADAIVKQKPLAHLGPGRTFATTLEITGRSFALAARLTPELGPNTAISVLRSET
ncbi:MAG: hypothetical protein JW940_19555 [Polyangiaceae bacterium]|nr:hypothetical protein [Polyangiaceae bacterium]